MRQLLLGLTLLLFLAACSRDLSPLETLIYDPGGDIWQQTATIGVGESTQYQARTTLHHNDGRQEKVDVRADWSLSDPTVAAFAEPGFSYHPKVEGLNPGRTSLCAEYRDKRSCVTLVVR